MVRSSFLVLLLTALASTGCGQTDKESLNEHVANRLATQALIQSAVAGGGSGPAPSATVVRTVAGRDDLSLDLKWSLALVMAYSQFRGIQNYRNTLDSAASLMDVEIRLGTGALTNLAGDAQYADNLLKSGSAAANVANRSNTSESFELQWNQKMDSAQAAEVIEVAARLTSAKQKDPLVVRDRLKSSILQAMQRHPDLLKPFAEQSGLSDELKKSRQRVKTLLEEAAKKHP
jgi:hypothetical protein